MTQFRLACQFGHGCTYVAVHDVVEVAVAFLNSHSMTHQSANLSSTGGASVRAPKIDRPVLKQDVSDEDWEMFKAEWSRFKLCYKFLPSELNQQLFQCCEPRLGNLLLKFDPKVCEGTEEALLTPMEKMAVLHVASTVRRTKLMTIQQAHGQSVREFFALVRSAASACSFSVKCPHTCCVENKPVDYTACMVKDVFICGLNDDEIKRDILAATDLDQKTDREVLTIAEEKEVARNAVAAGPTAAPLSAYNKAKRSPGER